MKTLSAYAHIPFCKQKCSYCDFISYEGKNSLIEPYFGALYEEIKTYRALLGATRTIDSVFIGGGTPNYVDVGYIQILLDVLRDTFEVNRQAEITMEANPASNVELEDFFKYRNAGINRLSIGLQSASNALLKAIGRVHTKEDFEDFYETARRAGYDNINVDLIFGFYEQSVAEWAETLDYVLRLDVKHISCYSLKLEEGTPLYHRYLQQGIDIEDIQDRDREMYEMARDRLLGSGFRQYELSSFALPGYESVHNLHYWNTDEYIGFGAGAHSYINDARFYNISDLTAYIEGIKENLSAIEEVEQLDEETKEEEFVIMALRKLDGVDLEEYYKRFGKDFLEEYAEQVLYLQGAGLLNVRDEHVCLSEDGLDFANIVMMEFVRG